VLADAVGTDRPLERRPEKVRRAAGADLRGWTPRRPDRKIDQLTAVIARMKNGRAPDRCRR